MRELPFEIPNFGRNQLAALLRELDFKKGVEVGVAAGEYSEILSHYNPQMTVIGIDPFVPYKGYQDYKRQKTLDGLEQSAMDVSIRQSNYILIKQFSMDVLGDFEDNSLDFVYIDANHAEPFVSQDIEGWYKKVRPRGILAGHDYIKLRGHACDVIKAVNRFTKEKFIYPWFVLGREAKEPGVIRDDVRSWMIIK